MVLGDKKGLVIFIGFLILVIVASFVAYRITGDMNIEERYAHAVGLENGGSEEGGESSGFALEGSMLLYIVVLGILATGCYAAYRFFRV